MTQTKPNQANILIVDDELINLKVLMSMLDEQGYQVRPAINGQVALTAVQKTPPDLILLDIIMPGMDGYELCRRLKANEQSHDIPIIFISGRGETEDKVKAFTIGGVDYITKPFQVEEVLARINTHLTIRNLQEQLQEKNSQLEEKNEQLQEKNSQLQQALNNIKTLKGLIPICANCKKIRDDKGFWQQVEVYVRDHSEAEFSHGICPDCMKELYPELHKELDEERQNILAALKKLGRVANLEDIAAAVGLPKSNILNLLRIMVKEGQLKCLGVNGENFYKLL